MQEAERIKAAKEGDQESLVQLLREVEPPLYRTAFYMLGNEQDALDATQDALLKVYQNIDSFHYKSKFLTWAQRIVTNVCIDKCRQRKERISIDEHDVILRTRGVNEVDIQFEKKLRVSELQHAIAQLSEQYRSVIILRYIHDYTYKEIAEASELPINTVKSHLYRAREKLQNLLQDEQKGGVSG